MECLTLRKKLSIGLLGMALTINSFADIADTAIDWRPAERWRGFNLLGMFYDSGQEPSFSEEEFSMISEFGFNFVRLPLDYRFWIKDGNWDEINEERIKPIDRAVEFGKKYGIHVQICFHRAPGYTVARPYEKMNLFKDEEALQACIKHWRFFAERYKGIPNEQLSFNLFNEPGNVKPEVYAVVAQRLTDAIRETDPGRYIIADGIEWGRKQVEELFSLNVGQAARGYEPMSISHYKANWVSIPSVEPCWPLTDAATTPLYGPVKEEWSKPLEIKDLPPCHVVIQPGMISGNVTVTAYADGAELASFGLIPGEGDKWTNVSYKPEWKVTQAQYTGTLEFKVPANTDTVSIAVTNGDWAAIDKLEITDESGQKALLPMVNRWGETNKPFFFKGFNAHPPLQLADRPDSGEEYLREIFLANWQKAFDADIFVMVGEFGAYNRTPHGIVLEWMEDNMRIWKELDIGWALWNFSGTFGILDSGRTDVQYEDYKGHKLDRKMLELLQRY
jgi:aryl-phospho-beta-D-glucosidase BglC (GH1 family)